MKKSFTISAVLCSIGLMGAVSAHNGPHAHLHHLKEKKHELKHKIQKQEHKANKALRHGNWFGFFKHKAKAQEAQAKKQHVKHKIQHAKHYF